MGTFEKVNGDYQSQLNDWINQEKAAIDLINVVGKLWFEKSIELVLFRNQLVDRSASEIMNLHLYANNIVKKPITVFETLELANEILKGNFGAALTFGNLSFEDTLFIYFLIMCIRAVTEPGHSFSFHCCNK